MLTATAMQVYNSEIERAAILAMFLPLIISSGGNSGSQATTLVIRAMALGELHLRDWFRVVRKELMSGVALGLILGTIGFFRITLWQYLHIFDYGKYHWLVALTVGSALVGVVLWGNSEWRDAPLFAPPLRTRSGGLISTICRHVGRRNRTGNLFQCRAIRSSWDPAVIRQVWTAAEVFTVSILARPDPQSNGTLRPTVTIYPDLQLLSPYR